MTAKACAILIMTAVAFAFASCEKDKELRAGGDACEDFSTSNDLGTNLLLEADIQHRHPCFNPQNGNEFIYVFTDRLQGVEQLRKHNLLTGEWRVLVETSFGSPGRILGPPSWGLNGWILFGTLGWDTWKVKDDGSGLTRLTFTGKSQWPIWNGTATLFHSGSPSGAVYSLIRDGGGVVIDTLLQRYNGENYGYYIPDWSIDGRICSFGGFCQYNDGHVIYIEYGTDEIHNLLSTTNLICTIKDIEWGSGETPTDIYFTTIEGLYRVDVIADKTCKVMDFCTSIGYETFSISPEGGFMLATRITTRVIDTEAWTIEFDRDIYRIDLTNFKETKIILP